MARSLPNEMLSAIENKPAISAKAAIGPSNETTTNIPQDEMPTNPSAYQLYQPKDLDNPAKREDVRAFFSKLGKAFKMKKSPTPVSDDANRLAQLNSWLKDPVLYPEALKRSKNAGYSIDYNLNGVALNISELDF